MIKLRKNKINTPNFILFTILYIYWSVMMMLIKNSKHLAKKSGFKEKLSHKLEKGLTEGWSGLFYKLVFCKIDESKFAKMYSDKGRPNFPVNILICLDILKMLFKLTDEQLIQRFHYDLQFMNALGIQEINEITLGTRTLYDFRKRLGNFIADGNGYAIIEIFILLTNNFIEKANIKTDIQRIDSTMIQSNMKELSRTQLMFDVMSRFVNSLKPQDKKKVPKGTLSLIENKNIKDLIDEIPDKEKRLTKLATEMYRIILIFQNTDKVQNQNYQYLHRVFQEQVNIIDDKQLVIKESKDIASNSLQNPTDEDATFRRKGNKNYKGFAVNIIETANPDNQVQMITNASIAPNIQSDKNFLLEDIPELKFRTDLNCLIADSGYHSPETMKLTQQLDIELVITNSLGGTESITDVSEFIIKKEKGIILCPLGNKPIKTKYLPKNDTYVAWFEKSTCNTCSRREQCLIKEQKKNMTIRFTKKRYDNDKLRKEQKTSEYKNKAKLRPAIEGTISALKRGYGLNQMKVRKLEKLEYNTLLKIIAYNFNQLIKIENSNKDNGFVLFEI